MLLVVSGGALDPGRHFLTNFGGFWEAFGRPWGTLGTPCGTHGRHFDTIGVAFRCIFFDLGPEPHFALRFEAETLRKLRFWGSVDVAET